MTSVNLSEIIAPHFYDITLDVMNHNYTHYWYGGGRGSCKSSSISIDIWLLLISNKDSNALVLRKVGGTLRDSVFNQLMWAADKLHILHLIKTTYAPLEITYLPTGQKIYFRGADDPIKIKSIKAKQGYIGIVWFEEVDQFNGMEEIRNILQSANRGGDKYWNFYSYNPPKSRDSWVNAERLEESAGKIYHHSTYETVPPEWLGQEFINAAEILRERKPQAYEHEYLGVPTGTGGAVFDNVTSRKITDEEIRRFSNIRRGLDFGYASDPTHYTEMEYDKTRKLLYIYFEIHQAGLKNRQAVNLIKAQNKNNGWITADSSEPRTIDEMRDMGLNNLKGAFKGADSVEHGIKYLQDLEGIVIDPSRCPNTVREFMQYELTKDKNGNFIAKFPDKNNHSIDAVRYALEDDMRAASISFLK